jgi:hypothetical protein
VRWLLDTDVRARHSRSESGGIVGHCDPNNALARRERVVVERTLHSLISLV